MDRPSANSASSAVTFLNLGFEIEDEQLKRFTQQALIRGRFSSDFPKQCLVR